MLWTKIDVCNLKSIRPNLKSIGAEKSDSENYLYVLHARYYCPTLIPIMYNNNIYIYDIQ